MAALSRKGKAPEQAVDAYARALAEDPWLWEAFVGLCDIGKSIESDLASDLMYRRSTIYRQRFSEPNNNAVIITKFETASFAEPKPHAEELSVRDPWYAFTPAAESIVKWIARSIHAGRTSCRAEGGNDGQCVGMGVSYFLRASRISLISRTPSNAGDTTFPTIHPSGLPAVSRRPLPNIISAFIPSLPASFRSNANTPASTPLSFENNHVKGPPAMKRPRGGHTRRPIETPQHVVPHTGRDLKSIEPNGEELAPVRRSSRLKSTTKPSPRVSEYRFIADVRSGNLKRVVRVHDLQRPCRRLQPQPSKSLRQPPVIRHLPRPQTNGFAICSGGVGVLTDI